NLDLRGFNDGVDGEGRAGFALAPGAVAAMDDQRRIGQLVADAPACTATLHLLPLRWSGQSSCERPILAWRISHSRNEVPGGRPRSILRPHSARFFRQMDVVRP